MTDTFEFNISQLPDETIAEIQQRLYASTIGFVKWKGESIDKATDAQVLGSGVCVVIGDVSAFITARHVVEEFPREGRLGLILNASVGMTSIDVGGIRVIRSEAAQDKSKGPDLALVVLSPSIAASIASKKTFLNVGIRREEATTKRFDDGMGLWVAQGFVAEKTTEHTGFGHYASVKGFCLFTAIGADVRPTSQTGPFDYFELHTDPEKGSGMPTSFGGSSGGGLWHVSIQGLDAKKSLNVTRVLLMGIIFYEDETSDGKRLLRCHGPRSIYLAAPELLASESSAVSNAS